MPRSSGRKVRQWIWDQATTLGYFYRVTMSLQRGFMINQHSSLLQYINLSAISWVIAKRNLFHLATREGAMKTHGEHNRIPLLLWRGETPGKLSRFTPPADQGKQGSGNVNPAACVLMLISEHGSVDTLGVFSKPELQQGNLLLRPEVESQDQFNKKT